MSNNIPKATVVFNDKPTKFNGNFFVIETFVLYYLLKVLKLNELRYILALLMTQNKFSLATTTIVNRTGLTRTKLIETRQSLIEKGFIDFNPYGYTLVKYNYIRELALKEFDGTKNNKVSLSKEEIEEIENQLIEIGDMVVDEDDEKKEIPMEFRF